jgi:hypothetical protein
LRQAPTHNGIPFFGGFLLVIGSALLITTLYQLAAAKDKAVALLAVVCTAAFTSLIFFNYICQTTLIPALLANYRPEYATIVATFSFANPGSLCWAIEMWRRVGNLRHPVAHAARAPAACPAASAA